MDIPEPIRTLRHFGPSERIALRLKHPQNAVGVVSTLLSHARAGSFLRDVSVANVYKNAFVAVVDASSGIRYSDNGIPFLENNPDKGVFLMEGARQTTRPLSLELLFGDKVALALSLPLSISPVEDFYRWVNLRPVCGDDGGRSTDSGIPANFPSEMHDGRNVVFIHGFSVSAEGARGWNAEMFKRLWQSGCNAAFYGVTWYGNDGMLWDVFNGGDNYHGNVVHAFETAASFASAFSGIAANSTILAHSLGNMVVSSAIQDHGFRPTRYFMLNAAVPAEAYDPSAWDDSPLFNPMVHEEWVDYASRTWASHWHRLFPTNDVRSTLTWKSRFADVPNRTELFNYYSTGDEVLSIFDTPDADGSEAITVNAGTGGDMSYHAWQKQERFKGRFGIDWWAGNAGTSDMGWGFSTLGHWPLGNPPMYHPYYVAGEFVMNYVRESRYTPAQAAAATNDAQLISDPVFGHGLFLGIPSASLTATERDVHLARGVPALSGPVGSRTISVIPGSRNLNLNGRTSGESWPRINFDRWTGWRHSDIKDIALPFVFSVFLDYCGRMDSSQ